MDDIKGGSKTWYIADGWMPLKNKTENAAGYEGHEAIMILNTNDKDAEVMMDIYFEDKEPVEGIKLEVSARRIKCFRMDNPLDTGNIKLGRLSQYGLRFRSNIEVVVQYGRMDVTQENLAYIGAMGYSE